MDEEWRDIPSYPNYQVSDLGRVRNIITKKTLTGCVTEHGYKVVGLCKNGKSKTFLIHILVALVFLGDRPSEPCGQKYDVNHKDLNRANATLSNLEYVTKSQNIAHSYENNPYWTRNFERYISPEQRAHQMEWTRKVKEWRNNGK